MKLVTYDTPNGARVGEWHDNAVHALGDITLLDIIDGAPLPARGDRLPEARLLAPLRPPKILCVGRNYADHAKELGNDVPKKPLIFAKYSTSVIGEGEAIRWDSHLTQQVDWEGELAVIIGKTAKNIAESDALDYVFGYTVANDVSARDLQDTEGQWARAKGMDTFCPLGAVVVTASDLPDPHALTIETRLNGEVVQHASTGLMFFKVPFLVAYLSQTFTLEAGDVILTGTPAGVGKGMKPPRFLKTGDVVSVTIDGIGTLTNPCMAD